MGKQLFKKSNYVFLVLICLAMCIFLTPHFSEAHPKDYTTLLEYDSSPLGNRTPLILVHGIHGNEWDNGIDDVNSPHWPYWQTFQNFFYTWDTTGLKNKYKLYGFWYESDQISVDEISQGFRDWIDERTYQSLGTQHKLEDVPFVIVAHSMGGLVSRAFMNQTLNIGNWAGDPAGKRTLKLITLATPHHGSPAANMCCRNQLVTNLEWLALIQAGDIYYWKWKHGVDNPEEPNRYDLRWDNWDGTMTSVGYNSYCAGIDNNGWLKGLNSMSTFDEKIIAYAGYIDPNDPVREVLVDEGPEVIAAIMIEYKNDDRVKAKCGSIALNEGLMGLYGNNDGMVPFSSARFTEHNNIERRDNFVGFDHGQMKGDELNPSDPDNKYQLLFGLLTNDLTYAAYPTLRIDGTTSSTKSQGSTFNLTGSNYTPSGAVTRYLKQPDGSTIALTPTLYASSSGNISWSYTSSCSDTAGTYSLWVKDNATGKTSNTVSEIITSNTSCNRAPIAEAAVSRSSTGPFYGYDNPLTVTKGKSVSLYFFANKDVNGDGKASLDPNGWTDAVNGVSSGGKAEWNTDLNQGTPTFEKVIANPSSAGAANIGPYTYTFNDAPGTYEYQMLRITDRKGAQSNVSKIRITVLATPTLRIDGTTSSTKSQGSTFNLTGSNYTPNGTVKRYLTRPGESETEISSITANSSGNISWSFTSSCSDKTGTYSIRVKDNTTGTFSNTVSEIITSSSSCNKAPVAEAAVSKSSTGPYYGYSNPLTVTKGKSVSLYFFANKDVNGDGKASLDPNGWTDAVNGVSSGGKAEWNTDLNQGTPTFEKVINSPASAGAANIGPYPYTFNDTPGTYEYQMLRITDKQGAKSNVSKIRITVLATPTLRIDGTTSSTKSQGSTFNLTGSNYTPNGTVKRYLTRPGESETEISSITANSSGNISWSFTSSCSDKTGTYSIRVKDNTTGTFSNTVSEIITRNSSCAPYILINGSTSSTKQQGGSFATTGINFTPNGAFSRYVKNPDGSTTTLSKINANGSGNISWTYTSSCSTKTGTYYVWTKDDATGKTSNTVTENITRNSSCP